MLISREYKFIFVHIYKNAGTSITTALRPFAISPWQWTAHRLIKKAGFPSPFFDPHPFPAHVKASEIKESFGAEKFNEYFSFAVVRNPWDWQVSLYKYALKSETHHQHELTKNGSSVCVMQWTGVIRDETLIETDITPTFINCFLSRANSSIKSLAR
ncbi:sulfotransferase family 2 domain-containing protein [Microcystis sp. M20BS1]|uniref:sulfotransferase family 2 domain-containing protein n=1 Tax=Microcystis sp. M20BS1 TaxID=2771181 RepID=UPI002579AE50|nr:sulfotransferase family 2 domain-containing protein [Microcystis sp. M20BS1]